MKYFQNLEMSTLISSAQVLLHYKIYAMLQDFKDILQDYKDILQDYKDILQKKL